MTDEDKSRNKQTQQDRENKRINKQTDEIGKDS